MASSPAAPPPFPPAKPPSRHHFLSPSSPPGDHRRPPPPSGPGSPSLPFLVGISVGGGAVLLIVAAILLLWRWRRRRRSGRLSGRVRPPLPLPPKDDLYGVQSHGWKQSSTSDSNEVHATMVPQYLPSPAYASRRPLPRPPFIYPSPPAAAAPPPPPSPPPQFVINSGGSGSTYSSEAPRPTSSGLSLGFSKSFFTYEELSTATEGFSDSNFLGEGGFGYVHRGKLSNGKDVAVKQLKSGSGQGEREFQAEVEIISRVHHRHLVSLEGYCLTEDKMLLVYEFVPNRTLEFHLHEGLPVMPWFRRMKIALGSAKGLAYLHEDCHPRIIHRDIKAANILLDFTFEAKVADFGLARFSLDSSTHVSTRVMGTFGYLAPEYATSGKLTDKSDVFSFGVMLLELITGRRPLDTTNAFLDDCLVDWARPLLARALDDGNYDSLVDKRLQNNYDAEEMIRMVACASACLRHSAKRRPRLSQIVHVLEGNVSLANLDEGVRPNQNILFASYGSSDHDSIQSVDDMRNFRKLIFSEQEFSAIECGSQNSEQSHNPSCSSFEAASAKEHGSVKLKDDKK